MSRSALDIYIIYNVSIYPIELKTKMTKSFGDDKKVM